MSSSEVVVLRGKARNAHAGAVLVRGDQPPVYIAGLADWGALAEAEVEAVGVLTESRLTPEPVLSGGSVTHGIPGTVHLLTDASWRRLS